MKSLRSYKEGRLNGSFVNYHGNGKIEEKYTITGGILSGIVEQFDDTGQMKSKRFYAGDGRFRKIHYFKDGRRIPRIKDTVSIATCKPDDKEKDNTLINVNNTKTTYNCKNGKRDGVMVTTYMLNGKTHVHEETHYRKG